MKFSEKPRKRKGQFFLIAGLMLAILFFMGLPKPDSMVQGPVAEDLKHVYENMEREFGRALALGLNESLGVDKLQNFTRFVDGALKTRYIGFDCLWVVAEGNTSSIINLSVGNFLGNEINMTLNLTDDGGSSAIKYIGVNSDTTSFLEFGSVTSDFNMTISFNTSDEAATVVWERDKVNLYVFMNLTRSNNIKRDDFDL